MRLPEGEGRPGGPRSAGEVRKDVSGDMCTAESRLGSPVLRPRLQEGSLEELSASAPLFTRGETRTGRLKSCEAVDRRC